MRTGRQRRAILDCRAGPPHTKTLDGCRGTLNTEVLARSDGWLRAILMRVLLSVFTIAGGHLLGGRRSRGYVYLVALVFLPVLSWIAQAVWIVSAPDKASHAPFVASIVFWVMLTLVWLSSIALLVLDRGVVSTERTRSRRTLLGLEAAAVSIASLLIVGFSVLSIGLVPFLTLERGSEVPVAANRPFVERNCRAGRVPYNFSERSMLRAPWPGTGDWYFYSTMDSYQEASIRIPRGSLPTSCPQAVGRCCRHTYLDFLEMLASRLNHPCSGRDFLLMCQTALLAKLSRS